MLWLLLACGDEPCTPMTWYADGDGDGLGGALAIEACSRPEGFVDNADDCDDARALNFESCNGFDDDCNGLVDDVFLTELGYWYLDADGDGYGGEIEARACDAPEGYVVDSQDCDDTNAERNPETRWHEDVDGDGFGATAYWVEQCERPDGFVLDGQDCDDMDDGVNPDAVEVCNGWDDDCDGLVDDADEVDGDSFSDWYADDDGDGYGGAFVTAACDGGSATVDNGDDCDDTLADVNPGELEVCDDGLDNDCSGDANDCGFSGALSSEDADLVLEGAAGGDNLGFRFLAQDVDGDGHVDMLAGAPYNDHGGASAGAAYLWSGPLTSGAVPSMSWTGGALYAGWDVGHGDFDGDGAADVLLGQGSSEDSVAYLVYADGAVGDVTFGDGDYAGSATLGLGDVDGDGLDDWLISDPGADVVGWYAGSSAQRSGAQDADATITGTTGSLPGRYGHGLAHGDLDGDGVTDVVVGGQGADDYAGAAWVFLNDLGDVADADTAIAGSGTIRLGHAVAVLPDVDGDGLDDLAVSAPYDGPGTVSIYAGGSAWVTFEGGTAVDAFGWSIDGGDVDGDGSTDLVAGARFWESGRVGTYSQGATFTFRGPVSAGTHTETDADARVAADLGSSFAGTDVEVADVDGDGVDDLLASQLDDAGSVRVFLGGGL